MILPKGYQAYPERDRKVLARKSNESGAFSPSEITLVDKYQAQFLGIGASLIPFVQHDDNNRVMMGAKNMKQAVPLLYPEPPLIKTGREALAAWVSGHAVFAKTHGRVEAVTEGEITLRTDAG